MDQRIEQSKKIIDSLVKASLSITTDILITRFNELIIIVDECILYDIPLKNITESYYTDIAFSYNDINIIISILESGNIGMLNRYIFNDVKFTAMVHQYNFYKYSIYPTVSYNQILRDDPAFERLINNKASDGLSYYKMIGSNMREYMIPIFSGFPNLNKQDTIGIEVRDMLNGYSIIKMNIFKKKFNRNIDMYFKILNL